MSEVYTFPPNVQAREATMREQAAKVMEEASEVAEAAEGSDAGHIAREAWDVVQAAEGILRKLPADTVERAHADVMLRCSRRGDYGEISDIE